MHCCTYIGAGRFVAVLCVESSGCWNILLCDDDDDDGSLSMLAIEQVCAELNNEGKLIANIFCYSELRSTNRERERERNMNKYTSMSRKKIAETKSFGECEALGIKNFRKNVLPKLQNYIVPFLVNNFAEIFCNAIIGNIVDILFIRCGRM